MTEANHIIAEMNEREAAKGFSRQAAVFDDYDAENTIIQYKRRRVREHLTTWLKPDSLILELNAGTGIDAGWLAGQGHRVHATDISAGMQEALRAKIVRMGLTDRVSQELCSFTTLDRLTARGPYDCIFSNFAGLNCTGELDKVLRSLAPLLRPGGQVTLVILPGFCLWETLLLLRGKFRTALRRIRAGRRGALSHVEGHYFRSWYYSPGYVIREMGKDFDVLGLEGLCSLVPPSYIEGFAEKHPVMYDRLCRAEDRWKGRWPWRSIGDYYIISFRKKG